MNLLVFQAWRRTAEASTRVERLEGHCMHPAPSPPPPPPEPAPQGGPAKGKRAKSAKNQPDLDEPAMSYVTGEVVSPLTRFAQFVAGVATMAVTAVIEDHVGNHIQYMINGMYIVGALLTATSFSRVIFVAKSRRRTVIAVGLTAILLAFLSAQRPDWFSSMFKSNSETSLTVGSPFVATTLSIASSANCL